MIFVRWWSSSTVVPTGQEIAMHTRRANLLPLPLVLAMFTASAPAQSPVEIPNGEPIGEETVNERASSLGNHLAPRSPEIPRDASPIVHFFYWLGNFHPAMASFPIALLVAGGVAELLLVFDKKPPLLMFGEKRPLASISRFCLWFAVLTGAVTGILGWLFAGFDITNRPELLQTHYWLGSSTVVWAGIVLFIGEFRFRRDRPGLRVVYRLALLLAILLVLATGFYGGAMIYGPDHYQWPDWIAPRQSEKQDDDGFDRPAATVTITKELTFEPHSVTITAGQYVLWVNYSRRVHTVTADQEIALSAENVDLPEGARPFNSEEILPGEVYKQRFTVPGHYKYFCIPHEEDGMIGEIVVRPKQKGSGSGEITPTTQ